LSHQLQAYSPSAAEIHIRPPVENDTIITSVEKFAHTSYDVRLL